MTRPPTGLSHHQARELLKQHGLNTIEEAQTSTPLSVFLGQFKNILVWLLILAAVVSFFMGEPIDGTMILAIVILNAIFGFVQEYKAEKAIAALKHMTMTKSRVIRDGQEQHIDASLIVPGDVVLLEQGDRIPADGKIFDSKNCEVNESMLTGESVPVEKNSAGQAHETQLFMGTIMTKGRATVVIEQTGMQTRFGSIANTLSQIEDEDTPLEKKTAKLGKLLGIAGIASSVLLFGIGILQGEQLFTMILTSISIAVAAVPEGLPAVITITLALGTQRMAKQRAILRKLAAIETLGSMSIIATDKTGTLTKNEMRIAHVWLDNTSYTSTDSLPKKNEITELFYHIGTICNTAGLGKQDVVVGDPTEGALLLHAKDHHVAYETLRSAGSIEEEFEFDATIKRMSVVFKKKGSKHLQLLTKGAPESLLAISTHRKTENGVKPLTAKDKSLITEALQQWAQQGYRLLALAYRDLPAVISERKKAEQALTFLGFVAIADPPRPEIAPAIALAKSAGIRTLMITGDNPITAKAVGTAVGLITPDEQGIITGDEFSALSDARAREVVKATNIFARISPEDKLRIVTLLQQQNHIVGVTGDGVNDALALKQADIGVAMGITGSDVAKGAADMVVTDDNYATIIKAVEEGRTIYENMKSSIKYLIGCNIGEVLSIIIATLLGWPIILTPLQILFINLVTDGLPALGLAVVPASKGIMQRRPNAGTGLFNQYDLRWLAESSIVSTMVIIFAFAIGQAIGGTTELGRTIAFTASIVIQQYIYLDLQARNRSIFTSWKSAPWLPMIAIVPIIIQIILLAVPSLRHIFEVTSLSRELFILCLVLPSIYLVLSEVRKQFAAKWYYPTT